MSPTPEAILAQLQATGSAYSEKKPGAREQLLNLAHSLISSLELPSEAIQRMGWAEVLIRETHTSRGPELTGMNHSPPEQHTAASRSIWGYSNL